MVMHKLNAHLSGQDAPFVDLAVLGLSQQRALQQIPARVEKPNIKTAECNVEDSTSIVSFDNVHTYVL